MTIAHFYLKTKLALEFCTFGREKSTTIAHFYVKMELALGFWTFGREKSTTVAHFYVKMELALGFWNGDGRHARILEPPGAESV